MTTPDLAGERIDQIVFAWSDRLLIGDGGFGPVASSLKPEALRMWNRLLMGGDVAVGQWFSGADECVALGALRLGRGGLGAVLRIVPNRDPKGRMSQTVHALVGEPAVVNTGLALGLHDWGGWVTPDVLHETATTLHALGAERLWAQADRELDKLAAPLEPLAGLLAGVLAAPSDRYLAAVEPDDYGLVAGLVRRLEAVAGREPWTIMLGAVVQKPEAQPRLLVLDLPEGRRGRLLLTPAGVDDPVPSFVGALLAKVPPTSLAPPRTPLTDTTALLAWVEAEHQRKAGVLRLIDAAIDGTLDEHTRHLLWGAPGEERLRTGLRSVDTPELAARLSRWAAAPPPGLAAVGRRLRRIAVERALTDVRLASQAAERLIDTACDMGVTTDEASGILVAWRATSPDIAPTQLLAGVYVALRLGIDPETDRTAGELLSGLPPHSLLEWSLRLTSAGPPGIALLVIRTAYARWRRSSDRTGDSQVRELMRATDLFHETIDQIVIAENGGAELEAELYRIVVSMAFGDPPGDLHAALSMLPADAMAVDFRPWVGLALSVGDREGIFRVAAHASGLNAPLALLGDVLHPLRSHELVLGLAEHNRRSGLLMPVCALLDARAPGREELRATREALFSTDFLITMVESVRYVAPAMRFRAYSILLGAAYQAGDRADGGGLTAEEVAELLASDGPPLFVAAVLDAAAADAVPSILLDQMQRRLGGAGLEPAVVERVLRHPYRWGTGQPREERPPLPAPPPVEHDPEIWSLS